MQTFGDCCKILLEGDRLELFLLNTVLYFEGKYENFPGFPSSVHQRNPSMLTGKSMRATMAAELAAL